ncbi:sulfite exporter TauE/SafE family protein [Saccharopolyspora rhizosphaerae]|uniref:Probable membrane transporter protein n=1 Tax=Saccharopolyspora rhizosphaerae TaxID=2492662 RepID=A0A426JLA8_9PSEU|nr:sulfite exporter TauE/SafE family protein [Saccharopolyspora rhizosphaerae]RRO13961.1 sulfite exporter TauE/SafE family protein [Saccharopolyspora rhizosphaerae]
MLLAVVFGAVIGLALGLLGAGGSILAVPALVYGVGQPLQTAIPTSLAVVALSSLGALFPRERRSTVRWPVALVFGAAGIPAAFGGAALGRLFPQRWLLLAFAALMVVVAVRMLRGGENHTGACRTQQGGINWRTCLPKSVLAGATVGVLTGLFGVGGGFIIVPALSLLLGLGAQQAVATSLVVVLINSVSGLVAHAGAADSIDFRVLLLFAGAALVVSVVAARWSAKLDSSTVRRWFAFVVLAAAVFVAAAALINPSTLG